MRRRITAGLVLAVLALAGAAGPAGAHGDTITFRVTAQVDGHTRSVASWANDGDPVTETLAATLSAVSDDGRTLGPWPLVRVAGADATFTTAEALPPGHWKVTVESGFPALGRGEADLTVTAVPETAPGTTAGGAAATGGAPASATASAASGTSATATASGASRDAVSVPGTSVTAPRVGAGWSAKGWVATAVALASCTALGLAFAARRRAYRAGHGAAA